MENLMKYIGGSLSICVFDIARGAIAFDEVEKISSGTRVKNAQDWDGVLQTYARGAWDFGDTPSARSAFQESCIDIAKRLIAEGKVEQPRLSQSEEDRSPDDGLQRGFSAWFDSETREPVQREDLKGSIGSVTLGRLGAELMPR
jgi:hypothetical protein